ncbi:VanZ family protein [Variovorax sp. JS1663]|uniref:VanZ family protein n=1 Tax=Variovorax sp. JS1663 TaxID=1851577 RepID=UPI000B623F12|nr:VanZ family protein [Variovorax sp. JS1663]OUL99430.1 hypothetical protein A8M77_26510 [Variovorax sp. JS1663]
MKIWLTRHRLKAWRGAFWSVALAMLVLSILPPSPQLPTTGWDKSNHVLGFAVLMMLGRWAYPKRAVSLLLLGLLGYGAAIECLQSLTPDRFAEWADLLADGIGLLCGWLLGSAIDFVPAWRRAPRSADE